MNRDWIDCISRSVSIVILIDREGWIDGWWWWWWLEVESGWVNESVERG